MAKTVNLGAVRHRVGNNGNWYLGDTDTGFKSFGRDGVDGTPGKDATINGANVLNIVDGANTTVEMDGNTLRINAVGGGQGESGLQFSPEEIERIKAKLEWGENGANAEFDVEYWTGDYYNGTTQKVYGKRVFGGNLPNTATNKTISLNIGNVLDYVKVCGAYYKYDSGGVFSWGGPLPFVAMAVANMIEVDMDKDNIRVTLGRTGMGAYSFSIVATYVCTDR